MKWITTVSLQMVAQYAITFNLNKVALHNLPVLLGSQAGGSIPWRIGISGYRP